MKLTQDIITYIENHQQEAFDLLVELSQIPAPSNHEELRAEFCKNWLERQGAKDVFIDDALNVIYPIGYTEDKPLFVFAAHSDVVFPDTNPLPLKIENGRIYCPGVGDDTAHVVAILMVAKYIAEHNLTSSDYGILLVVNSGEEGLGDLKGARKLFEAYGNRVQEFISFDEASVPVNQAVGSIRYRIEVKTEGGHSFSNFGNKNSIYYLASMIKKLYQIEVPKEGKTTYNVGIFQGGTSVNTIAQQAEMLYEFRSDNRHSLEIMKGHLARILEEYRAKGIEINVSVVGERPCSGDVDPIRHAALMERGANAVRKHYGKETNYQAASTDCNIPLSLGIPSICLACSSGGGVHTREEYVEIDSLLPGLKVCFELVLYHF